MCQDPDGTLLQNHAVPDRLTGLVPNLEGEITDPKHCAPGSFKFLTCIKSMEPIAVCFQI